MPKGVFVHLPLFKKVEVKTNTAAISTFEILRHRNELTGSREHLVKRIDKPIRTETPRVEK
jgi:hypothetical protein